MKCIICSGEMHKIQCISEVSRYNNKKYPLFKCDNCELVRPSPLPFQDHSGIEFYDEGEHIKFFDEKLKKINRKSSEYKYYYKHFLQYLDFIKKYKISGKSLDVGCGPGHLMELERKLGLKVEGMEVGKKIVKMLKEDGFKVKYGLLGETKLPKYNLITLNHVLEHIEDPEKAIKSIGKALNKKGYCIIAVPYLWGIVPQIMRNKWYGLGYGQHLNFFSKKSLKILFERNGFEIKEIKLNSLDYNHPKFPEIVNKIASFIMRLNVSLGLGDNLFVVAQKKR